jgi:hypothetical protein
VEEWRSIATENKSTIREHAIVVKVRLTDRIAQLIRQDTIA